MIVVISILGVIVAATVPRLAGFRFMAEERVCTANRKIVERMYSAFLFENDIDHEDSIFNQFLIDNYDEICTSIGEISYEYRKVKCSVHDSEREEEEQEEPGEEVPWL